MARRDVPAKVVIDEYVGIARDFFSGDEPGFINAALDTHGAPQARPRIRPAGARRRAGFLSVR